MSVRYRQVATSPWNINNSYDIGTVVDYSDNTYIAIKNVPTGVNIGMSDYWKKITLDGDVSELKSDVDTLETSVGTINSQINITVGKANVPFQFAYDSEHEVYGFMIGEVFHPFGGEVIGE